MRTSEKGKQGRKMFKCYHKEKQLPNNGHDQVKRLLKTEIKIQARKIEKYIG